jgi:hypothetical protein
VHTVVDVGGVSDTFTSTTLARPGTTYTGSTGSGTANVTLSGGSDTCMFTGTQFIPLSSVPEPPPGGLTFPHGLFEFALGGGCTAGGTVTLTITYSSALPAGTQYWKYGPTPDNATPHWYVLPAAIVGNTVTLSITDGGLGDDDLAANGVIVDAGGPGGEVADVPTLSEWGMILLPGLLVLLGLMQLRRRHDGGWR